MLSRLATAALAVPLALTLATPAAAAPARPWTVTGPDHVLAAQVSRTPDGGLTLGVTRAGLSSRRRRRRARAEMRRSARRRAALTSVTTA